MKPKEDTFIFRLHSIYTDKRLRKFEFSPPEKMGAPHFSGHRLERISDPDGSFLQFSYTYEAVNHMPYSYYYNRKINQIQSSNGTSLAFSYSQIDSSRVASISDHNGRVWTYSYDTEGYLIDVKKPSGFSKGYEYSKTLSATGLHTLTAMIDESGVTYATFKSLPYRDPYAYLYVPRLNLYTSHANGVGATTVDLEKPSVYGRLGTTTVTNSLGAKTSYKFVTIRGFNFISSITGPATACGHDSLSVFEYDPNGNIMRESRENQVTRYGGYDQWRNPSFVVDPTGVRTDYTYDPVFHRVQSISEPSVIQGQQKITTLTYNANASITQIDIKGFHPDGIAISRRLNLEYNGPFAQLSRVTGANHGAIATSVQVSYARTGSLELMDGLQQIVNDTLDLTYYANMTMEGHNRGRLKRVISSGVVIKDNIAYSATGKVIYAEYPTHHGQAATLIVHYAYDSATDRLMEIQTSSSASPYKNIIRYTYTATGKIKSIAKAFGLMWRGVFYESWYYTQVDSFEYDDAHRLIRHVLDNKSYIDYVHDTESNLTKETHFDQNGVILQVVSKTYDANGHLDMLTFGDMQLNYDYRADGLISKLHDVNKGVQTDYNYLQGQLQSITQDALQMASISQYEQHLHRITGVTDPIQNKTQYIYDDLGNLLEEISPDSGRTQYRYDQAGHVIWRKNALGTVSEYHYDAHNRLAKVDYAGTDEDEFYTYYDSGKRHQTFKNGVSTNVTYDSFGYLASQNNSIDQRTYLTRYYYYPNGLLYYMSYPSSAKAYFLPNSIEKTKTGTIYYISPSWRWHYIESANYHPLGGVSTRYRGNGLREAYTYQTGTGLPLDFKLIGVDAFRLQWVNGDIRYISDLLQPANNVSINYDGLGQLQQRYRSNPFDANGNHVNGLCSIYANSNQVDQCGYVPMSITYGYDLAGKITSTTTDAFYLPQPTVRLLSYGKDDRLRSVSSGFTYQFNGQTISYSNLISSYRYNVFGQRVEKIVRTVKRHFVYGLKGELIGEYDANTGQRISEYIYNSTGRSATITATGQIHHHFNNHLGMTQVLTDANQKVVWDRMYYGQGLNLNAGHSDPDHDGIKVENNFGFPGQYHDAETGLYYNWHRYYDPTTGRYTRPDPIGLRGGLNPYRYAGNNPVMSSDPTGLEILLQSHPVAFGDNHLKLTVIPKNQERWKKDSKFSNTLKNGNIYLTIGAGPEGYTMEDLVSNLNRPKDINLVHNVSSSACTLPKGKSEDEIIESLLSADANFPDNLNYDFFPSSDSDGYNSNSYISGIMNAVKIKAPSPANVPGFNKPIPAVNFTNPP